MKIHCVGSTTIIFQCEMNCVLEEDDGASAFHGESHREDPTCNDDHSKPKPDNIDNISIVCICFVVFCSMTRRPRYDLYDTHNVPSPDDRNLPAERISFFSLKCYI